MAALLCFLSVSWLCEWSSSEDLDTQYASKAISASPLRPHTHVHLCRPYIYCTCTNRCGNENKHKCMQWCKAGLQPDMVARGLTVIKHFSESESDKINYIKIYIIVVISCRMDPIDPVFNWLLKVNSLGSEVLLYESNLDEFAKIHVKQGV